MHSVALNGETSLLILTRSVEHQFAQSANKRMQPDRSKRYALSAAADARRYWAASI